MAINIDNKEIIYRYKTKLVGGDGNYHFNVPSFVVKNKYINVENEYWIYYIKVQNNNNKRAFYKKKQLQDLLKNLKNLIPFRAKPAKAGKQYRITIPKFLIDNKYILPEKEKGNYFWIYIVREK
jgi:hypothetical protein